MKVKIGGGWTAKTEQAEWSGGEVFYTPTKCKHGKRVGHSLEDALKCGMLDAVRANPGPPSSFRGGRTREEVAREVGVSMNTVHRWARGEQCPRGLQRAALVRWLTQGG